QGIGLRRVGHRDGERAPGDGVTPLCKLARRGGQGAFGFADGGGLSGILTVSHGSSLPGPGVGPVSKSQTKDRVFPEVAAAAQSAKPKFWMSRHIRDLETSETSDFFAKHRVGRRTCPASATSAKRRAGTSASMSVRSMRALRAGNL